MKICLIHPKVPEKEGSGASHSATQIAKALKRKGNHVTVYSRHPTETQFDFKTKSFNINKSKFSTTAEKYNSEIIRRKEEFEDFDIVHSYLMRTIPSISQLNTKTVITLNAYGAVCPRNDLEYKGSEKCTSRGRIKCTFCTAHQAATLPKRESDTHVYNAARKWFHLYKKQQNLKIVEKCVDNKNEIDFYHSLTNKVKKKYCSFGFNDDKITTIPNIFDPSFDLDHHSDFQSPYKLLYVGALKERKGADRLPKIMTELLNSNVDATLTIAGKGYLMPKIQSEIKSYGLEDVIDLRGHISYDKLPKLYATHDLFIYPARWDEPFGRVFLEAMGTGTPILSTDMGDAKSIIGAGGEVVEIERPADFATAIEKMLTNQALAEYSREGSRRVTQYSSSCIADQFLNLYQNAR